MQLFMQLENLVFLSLARERWLFNSQVREKGIMATLHQKDTSIQDTSFDKSLLTHLIRTPAYQLLGFILHHRFKIDVYGREHLPVDRPFILAANHSSHLDSLSLIIAGGFSFDKYVFLAAKDYFFDHKSLRLLLLQVFFNLAPFDRNPTPSAMKNNLNWCRACVVQNKNLIIFPEATRSLNGELQPFKCGCSLLAYELNLPIVPAYIKGAYDCLPKGVFWPKNGQIAVRFGQPLLMEHYAQTTSKLKSQIYKKITHDLEQQIKYLRTFSA